jgi:hypothetical protein
MFHGVSVPKRVGEMKGRGFDGEGLSDHSTGTKTKKEGRKAHEHYRTGSRISPVAASAGESDGVGLETVSVLWEHGDGQVGIL